MREFLRIVNMNVFDLLSHELVDERLNGALAFDDGKYGEYSAAPALEITIPSRHDDSLAGMDRHVMSPPLIIMRQQRSTRWWKSCVAA